MTANEFRETHGDPTTWTAADFEAQQNLAAIDQHVQAPDRERDYARCSQRWAAATNFRRYKKAA